ncbi:dephospho-CoA kinase [Arcanobacterium canis]|uniref:Dephospho-CoA kinase n=1 Tax=Arcanobacterium canis TaxID=999183 RepID=A0ABY8G0C3_9ACTO|nr:dephospho-CoA kinase [Arcanobacterium canis]WFM84153.1 dephospho-CoA kinase [Arcanobacterium canis]
MIVVVTGGIGSGKSTVSAMLSQRGAVVIDYDELAREAVVPGSDGLASIVQRWGKKILQDSGELNRAALGKIVFSDPDALAELNAIIHPAIDQLAATREAQIRAMSPATVIVRDVPLYIPGTGPSQDVDLVVTVSVPEEIRISRLIEHRSMTQSDARARIAHQMTDIERENIADVVIHNDGNFADLQTQVDDLWHMICMCNTP